MLFAYSTSVFLRILYSVNGWMFGLYQNPTGSMPSCRSVSMQAIEHGAQQMCSSVFIKNHSPDLLFYHIFQLLQSPSETAILKPDDMIRRNPPYEGYSLL